MSGTGLICGNCGNEEPEGSRFCGSCGAPVLPADQPPAQPAVPDGTMLTCAACGGEEPQGTRFCGTCGAQLLPADPQPADAASTKAPEHTQRSDVEARPTAPAATRPLRWVAVGAVALLVAGGAVAAVLVLGGDDASPEAVPAAPPPAPATTVESLTVAAPTLMESVSPYLAELAAAQSEVDAELGSLGAGGASLAGLQLAAGGVAARVEQTLVLLDGLPSTESTDATTLSYLQDALAAHRDYAAAISSLPADAQSLTEAQAGTVIDLAEEAQSAYSLLASGDPALLVVVDSSAHARLLELVPSTEATELTTFVEQVESVLVESASGRQELGSAIAAGLNCSITARAAGERVDRVVQNRQRLLEEIGSLPVPTPEAGAAIAQLRLALQHSIDADVLYRDGFYGADTSDCPLPRNASFTRAGRSDTLASAAKRRFVATYNPLATSVGGRTWSADEI